MTGGVSAPPSVTSSVQGSEQMPLQSSGEGAGMGSGEGEGQEFQQEMVTRPHGTQAPLGTPTATPGPAIGTTVPVMAEEGRQGAFAIIGSGRVPGFTPIREGPAPDVSLAPRAVHRPAVPPPGSYNLAAYYGVPEQYVQYIEGYGVAFVHAQTGTFYVWVERTQRFSTLGVAITPATGRLNSTKAMSFQRRWWTPGSLHACRTYRRGLICPTAS